MINNLELIKPLLTFPNEGDFYEVIILLRKKDVPNADKDKHRSVRTIREYFPGSIAELEKHFDEIVMLCEFFHARAMINPNVRNHKKVSLVMNKILAERLLNGQYNNRNIFDKACGQSGNGNIWIVDVDTKDENILTNIKETILNLNGKIITTIPTRAGYHLLTGRFNRLVFAETWGKVEIKTNSPTLLYFPDSIV